MTAQPSQIAHYRITSKLGEGGMGAVYRASDTKLNRDVAIKILPDAFAQDAARMQRFEREAQVLATLNHPNIAQIYGIEQGAIVMARGGLYSEFPGGRIQVGCLQRRRQLSALASGWEGTLFPGATWYSDGRTR